MYRQFNQVPHHNFFSSSFSLPISLPLIMLNKLLDFFWARWTNAMTQYKVVSHVAWHSIWENPSEKLGKLDLRKKYF